MPPMVRPYLRQSVQLPLHRPDVLEDGGFGHGGALAFFAAFCHVADQFRDLSGIFLADGNA